MKEIGRVNVTKEQLDVIFSNGHNGIPMNTTIDKTIEIDGFAIYDNEDGTYHLKYIDTDGNDYYTSSKVFIREFMRLAKERDVNEDNSPFIITAKEGTSNKGRKYYYIEEAKSVMDKPRDTWKSIEW